MNIKQLRKETNLSQKKFADLFEIPVATLQDWESERRKAPKYVIKMITNILEYKKMFDYSDYIKKCQDREFQVEQMLGVIYSATDGPDDCFSEALKKYIDGSLTLNELENNVNNLKYI